MGNMTGSSSRRKHIFGMTVTQVAVLGCLGLMMFGVMGLAAWIVVADPDIPSMLQDLSVPGSEREIIGQWVRWELTPTPNANSSNVTLLFGCDFGYPPNIEFFSDGTYTGMAIALWSDLFVWQGGEYQVLEDGRIKLQTREGYAVYGFRIEDGRLSFTDDANCEFTYARPSAISPAGETVLPAETLTETDAPTATPSPTLTFTSTIELIPTTNASPTRTRAPTWTLLPGMVTPTP